MLESKPVYLFDESHLNKGSSQRKVARFLWPRRVLIHRLAFPRTDPLIFQLTSNPSGNWRIFENPALKIVEKVANDQS